MERGNRRSQYFIVSAVTSAAATCGVSFAWATPVLTKFAHNEVGFSVSKEAISWMVSVPSIGFVLGSFIAKYISDKFGRRFTILASSIPILLGTICMIFAWEAWMLSCGRFLWGIGTGFILAVSVIYIAEISDKDIRGRLSLTNRFMMSFGCLMVITVGAFVSFQTLNYMLLTLPVMYLMVCWWIPESPYYLLKVGRREAARKTLKILTGIQNEDVLEERLSQMQSHVKVEMRRSGSLKEFWTGKRYRKAIIIVFGLKITQIMSGLHAIQNYLGPILLESKSGISITAALIIFGAIRFLLGIMSSVLVDRLGRRPLLVASFIGVGVLLAGIGIYFIIQEKYGTPNFPYTYIPFVSINLVMIIANLGYESVAYVVPAEIFPMNVKSIAMAMICAIGGSFNFLSVKTYQQIRDSMGLHGLFGTYAAAAFAGALFTSFYVPETKGKSLKEIQIELNGNIYDEEEQLNSVAVNNNTGVIAMNGKHIESDTTAIPANK